VSHQPPFTFAFQPIVKVTSGEIISFEALVRGLHGESAHQVLSQVDPLDLHKLDLQLRREAIRLASMLGGPCHLNLNLMPRSLALSPDAISSTLAMAEDCGIPPDHITLEITENEIIDDLRQFSEQINACRASGVRLAIDDFGAGYAGLNLLAEFQPDAIKLDMTLVRGIESRGPRQAIVRGIHRTCLDLGIDVIAEGVETEAEYWWFRQEGVELFQGYLFARPGLRQMPLAFYPTQS
jgi:blue light- and temperature-responsive anti-repressor